MIATGNSLYTPVSQLSALQLMVQTLALFWTFVSQLFISSRDWFKYIHINPFIGRIVFFPLHDLLMIGL